MAIRGVGTLFGEKQSGEMDSIGADLYLEFLYEQLEKIEMLSLNPITPSEVHVPVFPTVPKLTREYVVSDEARKVAEQRNKEAKKRAKDCEEEVNQHAAQESDRGKLPTDESVKLTPPHRRPVSSYTRHTTPSTLRT